MSSEIETSFRQIIVMPLQANCPIRITYLLERPSVKVSVFCDDGALLLKGLKVAVEILFDAGRRRHEKGEHVCCPAVLTLYQS
jgi:hypothetical protein